MVVGAFPVAKLAALFFKQIAKPIANVAKSRAKSSPFFRTYICMPPAQFYHFCEVKIKMWSMNLGKPVNIPKLNEKMAIDLGAELLGEGIIFVIASGILIAEYTRSARKENAKEEQRLAEMSQIKTDLKDLYIQTAIQENQIKELVRMLKIELPNEKFLPKPYSPDSIPEHFSHEADPKRETMFSKVKSLVWDAIELVLPTVDDEANKPGANVGQNEVAKADCSCKTLVIKEVKPEKKDGK